MSKFEFHSDEQLLELLKQSNHGAFEEIYNRYWLSVYRRLFKKIQNKEVAEEYTQDLFSGLWSRRKELHITSLIHYFNAAVRNLVVNYIRYQIRQRLMLRNSFVEIHSEARDQPSVDELRSALEKLPQKTGEIIKLSKLEGYSVKEIASKKEISGKAVEYHITKALKILRGLMKNIKGIAATIII